MPATHASFGAIQQVATAGYVPRDRAWRFRPDDPATWGEVVETLVSAWQLPASVTGMHFEGIGLEHPSFIHLETLYDICGRSGTAGFTELFRIPANPHVTFYHPEPRSRVYAVDTHAHPSSEQVATLLQAVAASLDRDAQLELTSAGAGQCATVSRGQLCELLVTR